MDSSSSEVTIGILEAVDVVIHEFKGIKDIYYSSHVQVLHSQVCRPVTTFAKKCGKKVATRQCTVDQAQDTFAGKEELTLTQVSFQGSRCEGGCPMKYSIEEVVLQTCPTYQAQL